MDLRCILCPDHSSLHPRPLDAPSDLLGCNSWKEVLLLVPRTRLAGFCHILHHYQHHHWCLFQIWRRVPCQCCQLDGRLLGPVAGYCWIGHACTGFNVSTVINVRGCSAYLYDSFAYCIKVYLHNMWSDDKTETQSSAGLPSYTTSVRARPARVVYRRVRKVLWLQWRGITIVVFILVDVIFFSIVFVWLNSTTTRALEDIESIRPFLFCLVSNPTDPEPCFAIGQDLAVDQKTVIAVLLMLSVS